MRYPGEVTVALVPALFPSEAARDRWFGERREAILARRAGAIALGEGRCRDSEQTTCDGNLAVMQEEQADDLRRLEALQGRAGVATQVAATAAE